MKLIDTIIRGYASAATSSTRSTRSQANETLRASEHESRRSWRPIISSAAVAVLVLAGGVATASAALTTPACLGLKLKAWSNLRKCQLAEEGKALRGGTPDASKCQARFQIALASIGAKAAAASIACRYGDNGDSTVTDYDTGLMWERKNAVTVTQSVDWTTGMTLFLASCNGTSEDRGETLKPGCSIYHDWRIPNILELETLIDTRRPGCGTGVACIDPIFEPTVANAYWSSTTSASPLFVQFFLGIVGFEPPSFHEAIRAVRSAL